METEWRGGVGQMAHGQMVDGAVWLGRECVCSRDV